MSEHAEPRPGSTAGRDATEMPNLLSCPSFAIPFELDMEPGSREQVADWCFDVVEGCARIKSECTGGNSSSGVGLSSRPCPGTNAAIVLFQDIVSRPYTDYTASVSVRTAAPNEESYDTASSVCELRFCEMDMSGATLREHESVACAIRGLDYSNTLRTSITTCADTQNLRMEIRCLIPVKVGSSGVVISDCTLMGPVFPVTVSGKTSIGGSALAGVLIETATTAATSGEDGMFEFALPAETKMIKVSARKPGYGSQEKRIRIVDGPATVVDFELIPECRGSAVPLTVQSTATRRVNGEWLQFRGDRKLTGRSNLVGRIRSPRVKWKHFAGSRESLLAVSLSTAPVKNLLVPRSKLDVGQFDDVLDEWGAGIPRYELEGKGDRVQVRQSGVQKIGKLLPDQPGLQMIEFETGYLRVYNEPLYGRIYTREEGEWKEFLRTEAIMSLYRPKPIVGDFDNDGRLEVAVTPMYDLCVLDLATGQIKHRCRVAPEGSTGRANGWLGALDVDNDGLKEFVLITDFENHIEVVGWRDGQLRVLWSRFIEPGITSKSTVVRSCHDPVQDVDGDGMLEVVVSIHNGTGDGRWHTEVINAVTGETKADLLDCVVLGVCDLDGDGAAEMFCVYAPELGIPDRSAHLSVLSLSGSEPVIMWQMDDVSFERQPLLAFPENVNSSNSYLQVVAGRPDREANPVFFTRRILDSTSDRVELTMWQCDGLGVVRNAGYLTGSGVNILAVAPREGGHGSVLVRVQAPGDVEAEIAYTGTQSAVLASRLSGIPVSPCAVGRLDGSRPAIVVQGNNERIVAFSHSDDEWIGRNSWSIPGRGMSALTSLIDVDVQSGGVVLADLRGDGTLATISASQSSQGYARLTATDSHGDEIWGVDFPRFSGASPSRGKGGITVWCAGHFTSIEHEDVLVSLMRDTTHSDESYMLDGRTGKTLWHRREAGRDRTYIRGCGGDWLAAFDYDRDGLDEALLMYPNIVVIDGVTGSLMLDRSTGTHGVFGNDLRKWTVGAIPVVVEDGDGSRKFLYAGNRRMLALLDEDGNVIWSKGPLIGLPHAIGQCVGDIDGDGKVELLEAGYRSKIDSEDREFRCCDLASGELIWKVPLPAGPTLSPAVADIDGDGRDECVVAVGNKLIAIGSARDGNSGETRWTVSLPGMIGPPAIADVEGDGRLTVVVACSDGYVYGVGDK